MGGQIRLSLPLFTKALRSDSLSTHQSTLALTESQVLSSSLNQNALILLICFGFDLVTCLFGFRENRRKVVKFNCRWEKPKQFLCVDHFVKDFVLFGFLISLIYFIFGNLSPSDHNDTISLYNHNDTISLYNHNDTMTQSCNYYRLVLIYIKEVALCNYYFLGLLNTDVVCVS